jgi:hypothetical protein
MFVLSKRFGAFADRHGPRLSMGVGPLVAAAGLLLLVRVDADVDYWTEVLPALLVYSLGRSATVAPLTATVLAAADDSNAGIASAVNNAVARVAALLATAAIGALAASQFAAALEERLAGRQLGPAGAAAVGQAERRTLGDVAPAAAPAAERAAISAASLAASTEAFRLAMAVAAGLVAAGGLLGLAGIQDPRRVPCRDDVHAEDCPGGQLVGHPADRGLGRPAPAPAYAAAASAAAGGVAKDGGAMSR